MSDPSGSAGGEASLQELQQRLATFKEQLGSIHEILQSDPTNNEFLTIAKDLVEVIQLTTEMIDLRKAASTNQARESLTTHATATDDRQDTPEIEFTPGTICEALSKGVWFPAYIDSLTARDTYNVQYLGFGNNDELPGSSLRLVKPSAAAAFPNGLPPRDAIDIGFKCMAKYYVDGVFYTAAVTARTAHGYQVFFDGYGNSEEVPYEYMRPLPSSQGDATQNQTAATAGPVPVPAEPSAAAQAAAATGLPAVKPRDAVVAKAIKVPEHLVVLPTDSEAEKDRKHKRLKTIQKLNKQIQVDNTHNLKQHDWKSFQHKAVKKNAKGSSVLAKRSASMFATPDSVHGRVGVVGSGQGMTHFDDTRKKIKKSHLENAPRL